MEDDEDDFLLASLGGSLIQQLLNGLQGDDDGGNSSGWLSMEQLEQELAYLDPKGPAAAHHSQDVSEAGDPIAHAPPVVSAASMVVNQQLQQQPIQVKQPPGFPPIPNTVGAAVQQNQAPDAWSLSLQKFASASLQEDFLQADSARKQQQKNLPPSSVFSSTGLLANAQEYDVQEEIHLGLPPGLVLPPPPPPPREEQQQSVNVAPAGIPVKVPPPSAMQAPSYSPSSLEQKQQTQNALPAVYKTDEQNTQDTTSDLNMEASKLLKQITSSTDSATQRAVVYPPPTPPSGGVKHETPTPPATVAAVQSSGVGTAAIVPAPYNENSARVHPQQQPPGFVAPDNKLSAVPIAVPIGLPPHGGDSRVAVAATAPPQGWQQPVMQAIHQHQSSSMHPQQPPAGVVVLSPPSAAARPPPVTRRYYCHPNGQPVPAAALKSRYMSARDIGYVVHGILRPVLTAGTVASQSDYDLQFWFRQQQRHAAVVGGAAVQTFLHNPPAMLMRARQEAQQQQQQPSEDDSRALKSKSWSDEKSVLGHVTKASVTRPRALIAQPIVNNNNSQDDLDDDEEGSGGKSKEQSKRQQRAALWKARVYCDQAYQALQQVVDAWRSSNGQEDSSNGNAAFPLLQAALSRLMKCLGIQRNRRDDGFDENAIGSAVKSATTNAAPAPSYSYAVDDSVLRLLLKLDKGHVLLARVLEQALLPPDAVQALLPSALSILCRKKKKKKGIQQQQEQPPPPSPTDDRLFMAWTRVVQNLPRLTLPVLLEAVKAMTTSTNEGNLSTAVILASVPRLQCAYALLHRGQALVASVTTTGEGEEKSSEEKEEEDVIQEWIRIEQSLRSQLT